MLKITNLTAGYGGPIIVENIHIEVREGEIVTLIGPNGAGKSTVLKSIFGLTKIADGEILFFNQNLVGLNTSEVVSRGICYVPQGRSIFPSLTVEENLEMGAYILRDKKKSQTILNTFTANSHVCMNAANNKPNPFPAENSKWSRSGERLC